MDILKADVIGFISAIIGCVAWFIKLEARSKSNEKDINVLKQEVTELMAKHVALDNKILLEISRIRESMVRLETIFNMFEHSNNVNKKKERN